MKKNKIIGIVLLIFGLILLGLGVYYQMSDKNDNNKEKETADKEQEKDVKKQIIEDVKWGTPSPIVFEDEEYGIVEVVVSGTFSYQISEDEKVSEYDEDNMRSAILVSINNILGNKKEKSYSELPTIISEEKQQILEIANEHINKEIYEIININILSINLTEESEQKINDLEYEKIKEQLEN